MYVSDIQKPKISTGETQQHIFEVDANTKVLNIALMTLEEDVSKLNINLISPQGVAANSSNFSPDAISNSQMLYQFTTPAIGKWTVEVKANSGQNIQYNLTVTADTDFWVGMNEGEPILPNQTIPISAYVQKGGMGKAGMKVTALIAKQIDEGDYTSKYASTSKDLPIEEVALVDVGNGIYQANYNKTIETGTYSVLITATDPSTGVSRIVFTTFFVEHQFDLSVQATDIALSNSTPKHGEIVNVSAKIYNNTSVDVKGVEVLFADGELNKGGNVFSTQSVDILANGNTSIQTSWRAATGTESIVVVVSPNNSFIEENIKNNIAIKAIKVIDKPPVANAGKDQIARFDKTTQSNVNIFLDGSGSTDELEIKRYSWDIDVTHDSDGDGIPDNDVDLIGAQAVIKAGTYTKLGEYKIKLMVFDAANQSSSDNLSIRLTEDYDLQPPIANAGEIITVDVGKPVYFNGSKSTDNYGIALYMWDTDITKDSNGDGIPDNDVDLIGANPVFKEGYPNVGSYTAKLTVIDVAGNNTNSSTVNVQVNPLPISCSNPSIYDPLNSSVVIQKIDVPTLSPWDGKPTGMIAVFEAKLQQMQGISDFKIIPDSLKYLSSSNAFDPNNARFEWNEGMFSNGGKLQMCVSVPSVVVVNGMKFPTSTKNYSVVMKTLAVDSGVFHIDTITPVN